MYSIKQSKEGDLLLIIEPQDCDPDFPLFIYDGGDTALLFRDWGSTIRLGSISMQARAALRNAEEIYVVEMQETISVATISPPSESSATSKA